MFSVSLVTELEAAVGIEPPTSWMLAIFINCFIIPSQDSLTLNVLSLTITQG